MTGLAEAFEHRYPGALLYDGDRDFLYFTRAGKRGLHRAPWSLAAGGEVKLDKVRSCAAQEVPRKRGRGRRDQEIAGGTNPASPD